jgi:hypothetical protein
MLSIPIYTDFDRSMVKQDSPLVFMTSLFFRNPEGTVVNAIKAFYRYGLTGVGFIEAIRFVPHKLKVKLFYDISCRLNIKRNWLKKLLIVLEKRYISKFNIVIMTRTVSSIPNFFMKKNHALLRRLTKDKFDGNWLTLGNSFYSDSDLKKNPELTAKDFVQINRSVEKDIPRGAIYMGDRQEYRQFRKEAPMLQQMEFVLV